MRTFAIILGAILIFLGIVMLIPSSILKGWGLGAVETLVHFSTPTQEITTQELQDLIKSHPDKLLIFDVREQAEYDESRLQSAIHLPPQTTSEDFMRLYGNRLRGNHVIFYCSVGKRSGDALQRLGTNVLQAGAASAKNLKGGIFRWRNSGGEVVNSQGATRSVHPFNRFWGIFVMR